MAHCVSAICVFCGASAGLSGNYRAAAADLGTVVAERGFDMVYGAGRTGLMGVVAEAALAGGAQVTGIVPRSLNTPELVHQALSRLEVVPDLYLRKARMVELSDAFVALPGGYGTLDELLEAITLAQLGFHQKPVGALNVNGYFDALLAQLQRSVADGFLPAEQLDLLSVASDPRTLLDQITTTLCAAPELAR
jgi:uncharacterized protein (TIGR00730 family)